MFCGLGLGLGFETLGFNPQLLPDPGQELVDGAWSFLDTAAIIGACDLIISSDSVVAHLAGALGRPVWVMLKQVPDWRLHWP